MSRMQGIYESFTPEQKEEFWKELLSAMKWRGWDKQGQHKGIGSCHACTFIAKLDELCLKNNREIEEYT